MTPVRLIGFHEMDSALVDEGSQGGEGEDGADVDVAREGGGEGSSMSVGPKESNGVENDDSASSLSDDQRSTGTIGYPDDGNGMNAFWGF